MSCQTELTGTWHLTSQTRKIIPAGIWRVAHLHQIHRIGPNFEFSSTSGRNMTYMPMFPGGLYWKCNLLVSIVQIGIVSRLKWGHCILFCSSPPLAKVPTPHSDGQRKYGLSICWKGKSIFLPSWRVGDDYERSTHQFRAHQFRLFSLLTVLVSWGNALSCLFPQPRVSLQDVTHVWQSTRTSRGAGKRER